MTVKLLPFDNKSELQVIVGLPRGASLEETDGVLHQAARRLADLKELSSIQSYAGTATPFNFNGLFPHYYLRSGAEQGDLQINLTPKSERSRTSHDIALDVRKRLVGLEIARAHVDQGRGSAARATGNGDPARRNLRTGCGHAACRCQGSSLDLQIRALHCRR